MSETTPNPDGIELKIGGMHCPGCASGIESQLKKLGLKDASVDFASQTAYYTPNLNVKSETVASEIEKLGFSVGEKTSGAGFTLSIQAKFLFSLIWTLPLFSHMFLSLDSLHDPWNQLFLCIPVYALGFLHFGLSAIRSLRSGVPNMDVLIFIGITSAFVYSLTGTLLNLGPNYQFYETAATITSLVFLGNLLEEKSVRKTTTAIDELSKIQPQKARRVISSKDGEIVSEIMAEKITPGDILLANSGDQIPTDGEVVWGQASIDQSMISGESLPLNKDIGSMVIGGTIVLQGSLKLKATQVGSLTVLSNIIKAVKEARKNKADIQKLADQISAYFVPAVLLFAIGTLLVSFFFLGLPFQTGMLRSIAVLVIACPCAMGLATPTAIMVGIGLAAKRGILVKGGQTLELFGKIKRIAFDKTGTLTSGKFKIKSLECFGTDANEVRSIIYSLETFSSHPIAKSLASELADSKAMKLSGIEETSGGGISAAGPGGEIYKLGSKRFTGAEQVQADLFLTRDSKLIAALTLEEAIKPNAAPMLVELTKLGISYTLISGDTEAKCSALAHQLGIEHYYSERSPQEKLDIISDLERQGPSAFVGDGINDAPALSKASVGVSLSDATQVAIQSAQIVLLNGDLERLVQAIKIARLVLKTIKQNLFWAFFYNVLAIPLAAAGCLNPMLAALSMAFSDVVIIANSLRLKAFSKIA